jgi:hypothetical protein
MRSFSLWLRCVRCHRLFLALEKRRSLLMLSLLQIFG